MESFHIDVEAIKIDRTHIHYVCPYCKSRYNKDGKPSKRCKPVIHRHGSNNDLSNRIEHRSHDKVYNFPKNNIAHSGVYIHITDNTKRE